MTAWLLSQATFAKMHHAVGAFVRVRCRSSLRPPPLLTADPIRALIDEKIRIRAGFLPPLSPVTLWTQMHCEEGDLWQSFAHYNTDSDGTVDLSRDASVGGSYVGCEPMGLFWALQPAPGGREGLRLRKRNVQTPYVFNVSLLEGHLSPGEEATELAALTAERWYMAPGVKRIEVRQHGLVGTLFLPPGPGPFPAMLDLWGMGGGLFEYRSALLASRGYASFSLAYFGVKEIPGPLNRINVGNKYYKTAFQFLQNHEQVCSDRVGILGLSYGCYLTLRIATLPGVKPSCLICINGPVGSIVPLSEVSTASLDDNLKHWDFDDQDAVSFKFLSLPENFPPENIIQMEKINCPIMFIVGEDDLNASSIENANMLEETLKAAGKGHLFTRLSYPGAGHLIEPPYSPNARISLWSVKPKKLFTLWGGHLAPHAAAQEDAWRKVLDFLNVHLRGDRGRDRNSKSSGTVSRPRRISSETMTAQATLSKLHHAVGAFMRVRCRSSLRPPPLLTADPIRALIDEKIRIRAGFLPPVSPVTLWTQMYCEEGDLWQSFAHYNTDSDGTVDVSRDASVGGSYVGCEPMGLFWALQPAPGGREGLRLRKRNVQTPYVIHVSLLEGHLSPGEEATELAALTAERWYMAPGVKRIEVRQHGLVGTLFLPPGPGPFPAVLDLWGMGGGLVEYRSSLLASRGYASFSLAYFGHKELPGPLNRINVGKTYFQTAFQFLQNHEQVFGDRVGILGLSYGVYLTLRIATLPDIKPSCLICINGPVGSISPLADEEGRTESFESDQQHWTYDDQGNVSYKFVSLPDNIPPKNKVKIEKIDCPVMYIVGEDDLSASSQENANLLEERLKAAGKGHLFTRLSYPGAGHLIEPPYSPNARISLWSVKPKKLFTLWGGHLAPHAAAQEDAWRKVLDFLNVHLRGDRG